MAATTAVTPTIAQYYIPEIWANTGLEVLADDTCMPMLVTKDSEVTNQVVGDVLHIPYPGTFSANDKTAGDEVTVQTPSGSTEVQLTLDTHKEVTFIVEDIVKVFQNQDLMAAYFEASVYPLGDAIEDALLGLYAGLSGSVGSIGTDLDFATMQSAKKTMRDNKTFRKSGMYAVVSTKDEKALVADADLRRYFDVSNTAGITEGAVARLAGFDMFVNQRVIESGGGTYNMAFNRGAFILGMRGFTPPPPGVGAVGGTQTDKRTGLVLSVVMSYNAKALGTQVTTHVLFGVKELRDAKAIQLIS